MRRFWLYLNLCWSFRNMSLNELFLKLIEHFRFSRCLLLQPLIKFIDSLVKKIDNTWTSNIITKFKKISKNNHPHFMFDKHTKISCGSCRRTWWIFEHKTSLIMFRDIFWDLYKSRYSCCLLWKEKNPSI